jgi:hypothetical protein
MKKRESRLLIALPGLAVVSWLVPFLLLSGSTVGAASDGNAVIPKTQSARVSLVGSSTLFAMKHNVTLNGPGSCNGAWIVETVDDAGDVGRYTSLALEPTYPYTPHISYLDSGIQVLKHAWLSGTTWLTETVDEGCGRTSLALVPTPPHTPVISYDGCEYRIKFAWCSDTTWTSMTVPGPYAVDSSLALEPTRPYTPHISFFWDLGTVKTLHHAYLSGTTWVSGTWVYGAVEPPNSEAGRSSSLALEPTFPYTPHISYRSPIGDSDLKHAWLQGTSWLSETVDSAGDKGKHTSLALDSSGNPCISYFDDTNNALKYAWLGDTTWFSKTVDDIGEPPYNIGHSSLGLNPADLPYISYYDATDDSLRLAYSDGTDWFTRAVDGAENVGQYSSLALDPLGCPHLSYYDAARGALKYAYLSQLMIYLPLIIRNEPDPPCIPAGELLWWYSGDRCCGGLSGILLTQPCDPPGIGGCGNDGCSPIPPCACSLCAPCGDGVCQPEYKENRCSCPSDCE